MTHTAVPTAKKQQWGTPYPPGFSGNPAGRTRGSKNRFTEDFWRDLHKVWSEHGLKAMQDMVLNDPAKFVTVAAHLIPTEVEVSDRSYVLVVPARAESVEAWLKQREINLKAEAGD